MSMSSSEVNRYGLVGLNWIAMVNFFTILKNALTGLILAMIVVWAFFKLVLSFSPTSFRFLIGTLGTEVKETVCGVELV